MSASDHEVQAGMFAVLLEARRPAAAARTQWVMYPANVPSFGSSQHTEGAGLYMKRAMNNANHRAKWEWFTRPTARQAADKIALELDQYASTGFTVVEPALIRLEADDYEKAWAMSTPYKALRHFEAVTQRRGYRITGAY